MHKVVLPTVEHLIIQKNNRRSSFFYGIENIQFIHSSVPSVNTLFTFMFIVLTLADAVTLMLAVKI